MINSKMGFSSKSEDKIMRKVLTLTDNLRREINDAHKFEYAKYDVIT